MSFVIQSVQIETCLEKTGIELQCPNKFIACFFIASGEQVGIAKVVVHARLVGRFHCRILQQEDFACVILVTQHGEGSERRKQQYRDHPGGALVRPQAQFDAQGKKQRPSGQKHLAVVGDVDARQKKMQRDQLQHQPCEGETDPGTCLPAGGHECK